jgi:hypothetical protein
MACNIMSWSIACAMQQLLIVMLIFQQLLLGVHSLGNKYKTTPRPPFTNQTDGRLLIIHFHYSFVIFVSVRESMRYYQQLDGAGIG